MRHSPAGQRHESACPIRMLVPYSMVSMRPPVVTSPSLRTSARKPPR